jgi:hypothetical protein
MNNKKDIHLFIVGQNGAGTSFLLNSLALCENGVAFQKHRGMEGKRAAGEKCYPPEKMYKCQRFWSEKKEIWLKGKGFNWREIKNKWNKYWEKSPHYKKADPKIFIEKTPLNVYLVKHLQKHFKNSKFIILVRNPYAMFPEAKKPSFRGSPKEKTQRIIQHWIECTKQQIKNIKYLEKDAIWFTYENMADNPDKIKKMITNFIPALRDLDFHRKVLSHSKSKKITKGITNFNESAIKRLLEKDVKEINLILKNYKHLMSFFGYKFINK